MKKAILILPLKFTLKSTLCSLLILGFAISFSFTGFSQETISFYNFDADISGWTTGASGINSGRDNRCSWTIGNPNGGQGYNDYSRPRSYVGNVDPTTDFSTDNSINNVAGQGLSTSSRKEGYAAHYNNSNEWIQSPAINCSNYFNTSLSFMRWANFEPGYDFAYVEISTDGNTWTALNHSSSIEDTEWTLVELDISQYADRNSDVYIRWRSESDDLVFYSGWNIDDVRITGDYTSTNSDSKITTGSGLIPENISSLVNTYEERISTGDFSITDAGSGDGLPTILDSLIILAGDYNTITNWKNAIGKIYLTNNDGIELKGKVRGDSVIFANNSFLTIADGTTENYELSLYLNDDLSEISEREMFDFEINYSNQVVNSSGSFLGSGSFNTGKSHLTITIEATELRYETEPEALISVDVNILPTIVVIATDINGNLDIDFTSNVSLSNSGSLDMVNKQVTASAGIATFDAIQFTETGGPVTITTSHDASSSIQNATTQVQVTIQENINNTIFFDDFDNSGVSGWTSGALSGSNSWETGTPSGGFGYSSVRGYRGYVGNADPSSDYSSNTINKVYGQGLSTSSSTEGVSSYYNSSDEWLMTPAINCSNYYNVQFSFLRWANFEADYDSAKIEISTDGITWTELSHPSYPEDKAWTYVSYDISKYADRNSSIYIRWRSISDNSIHYSGWNIDDVRFNGIFSPSTTWLGTISSDWNTAGNWSTSTVPNEVSIITIPSGTPYSPIITSSASNCNDLKIETEASLQILNAASLTVFGDLTIETTSSSYGSIIDYGTLTVYGLGKMARHITDGKWQYVASPFSTTYTNSFGDEVYTYNEPAASENWAYGWQLLENEIMQPGLGYDIYQSSSETVNMEGQFNTGTYSVTVTNTDGAEVSEHEGWNLVGNPYPSAIDWDATTGWAKENINNAIYIWDKDLQNFVTYISGVGANGGTNYIPPMQGFFIKVSSPGTATLQMTNDVRVAEHSVSLKSSIGTINQGLNVKVSSTLYSDEAVIRFSTYAGNEYEAGLDAEKKFTSNTSVPQIYTLASENEQLAINTLYDSDEYEIIPLYFTIRRSGDHILDFDGVYNVSSSKSLYLEDLQTGELIDLKEQSSYEFYSSIITDSSRFVLHLGMPLSIETSINHVSYTSGDDGSVDISVLGGNSSNYTFEWSNGETTEDIDYLTAGTYTVIITDASNNAVTETIVVMQADENGELTAINSVDSNEKNITIYAIDNTLTIAPEETLLPVDLIRVFDMNGKTVYSSNKEQWGELKIEINGLKGIYIVQVKQDKLISSQKVIF